MPDYIMFILLVILLCKKCNTNISIKVNVMDEDNKPLKNTMVIIKPCNLDKCLKLITDCSGSIIINNIPVNRYQFLVYTKGYNKKIFFINACNNINLNICLCKYKKSRIHGYIKDIENNAIDEAIVVLYKVLCRNSYKAVKFDYTDFMGEYNFIDIEKGCYIIKSIK